MKEIGMKYFNIYVTSKAGQKETIKVKYKETTDGVAFYEFLIRNQKIQIRKDEKWEQIWGNLSPQTVEEIGAAIEKAH